MRRLGESVGPDLTAGPIEDEAAAIDVLELANPIAQTAMRALMLGALDSEYEQEADVDVEPALFEYPEHLKAVPKFTMKPFQEAIDEFDSRRVVTRRTFDRMAAIAKARAFTVAGLAKKDLVQVVRDELKQSIVDGNDLRKFRKALKGRAELRGWLAPGPPTEVPTVPGKPWHIETIYRNGVRSSHSRGQMIQRLDPDIRAAFPYWEIRTVPDDRRRNEHAKLHGKVLAVDDPFWRTVGAPPWGFNCRCRLVARTRRQAERKGVTTGAELEAPDKILGKGWTGQRIGVDDLPPDRPAKPAIVKPPPKDAKPPKVRPDPTPARKPKLPKPPLPRRAPEQVELPAPDEAKAARSAVEAVGGIQGAEFLKEGFRPLDTIRKAFAGATPAQATKIATGKAGVRGGVALRPGETERLLDPIRVNIDADATVHLVDGRHRMLAAIEAGATEIRAKVRRYDDDANVIWQGEVNLPLAKTDWIRELLTEM